MRLQRACLLAHQLSRFASSNGAEGGSVEQPVWDEEDDMKPSNRPKRRERRRSRPPRFSGVQVAAALDLLATALFGGDNASARAAPAVPR